MTKIVQVKCPKCNTPVHSRNIDNVFLCEACGTLNSWDGNTETIEYEAGAFTRGGEGTKVYLPFWKTGIRFFIRHSSVKGGFLSKLSGILKGDSPFGEIEMMIPAFDIDPGQYKKLAEKLTIEPPKYDAAKLEHNVERMPCEVTADRVKDMADFLFVTFEAEKPGVLQKLDYDLYIMSKKLVYLPYYKKEENFESGF
ncbi:hypothetical protein CUJ83_13535 [Methanocella sp. CWC-04]|uniref:Uncharacterized protein n=1 Tax=Methanooceanicella nereidis TaxID=2052831 RepID=A0AAP2RH08_9EURY|nr:hypothetical protein [Methanocella sp. CWC-04]MCD1296020.1 hypothetical protein [Methanocella sp. CWC-04]